MGSPTNQSFALAIFPLTAGGDRDRPDYRGSVGRRRLTRLTRSFAAAKRMSRPHRFSGGTIVTASHPGRQNSREVCRAIRPTPTRLSQKIRPLLAELGRQGHPSGLAAKKKSDSAELLPRDCYAPESSGRLFDVRRTANIYGPGVGVMAACAACHPFCSLRPTGWRADEPLQQTLADPPQGGGGTFANGRRCERESGELLRATTDF